MPEIFIMENDAKHQTSSHFVVPRAPEHTGSRIVPWLVAVLAIALLGAPLVLSLWRTRPSPVPSPSRPASGFRSGHVFSEEEFKRGWYWGGKEKAAATPEDWVVTQDGTQFCWHKPAVSCPE